MSTTDQARAYADRILAMARFTGHDREEVSTLLFLAYMRGWTDATQDEIDFIRKTRETA